MGRADPAITPRTLLTTTPCASHALADLSVQSPERLSYARMSLCDAPQQERIKLSDWEGGIRVTAFIAGGWVPPAQAGFSDTAIASLTGSAYHPRTSFIAAWVRFEWLCCPQCDVLRSSISHPERHAAAAAGLPPVDSMVSYLRGDLRTSHERNCSQIPMYCCVSTRPTRRGYGNCLVVVLLQLHRGRRAGRVSQARCTPTRRIPVAVLMAIATRN